MSGSVIRSLDEWYEAYEIGKLQFRIGDEWRSAMNHCDITQIKESMEEGRYRWAPEELTLVEWRYTAINETMWCPESDDVANRTELSGWKPTGRTLTGVVKEPESE